MASVTMVNPVTLIVLHVSFFSRDAMRSFCSANITLLMHIQIVFLHVALSGVSSVEQGFICGPLHW